MYQIFVDSVRISCVHLYVLFILSCIVWYLNGIGMSSRWISIVVDGCSSFVVLLRHVKIYLSSFVGTHCSMNRLDCRSSFAAVDRIAFVVWLWFIYCSIDFVSSNFILIEVGCNGHAAFSYNAVCTLTIGPTLGKSNYSLTPQRQFEIKCWLLSIRWWW